jgi:cob(I)alamin adenosyltransferase
MRVLILQFLKGSWHYGELDAVAALGRTLGTSEEPAVVLRQMGRGFVKVGGAETDPEDVCMVGEAWNEAAQAILSEEWDLVVLDEINYAIGYKMLDAEKVAEVLRQKPEMVHVILTGRNAHPYPDRACRYRYRDAGGQACLPEGNPRSARHRVLT